jgi:hypothetical protein
MVFLAGECRVCPEPFRSLRLLSSRPDFLSLVIGFVLSLLGSILLFLGQLWTFAGKSCSILRFYSVKLTPQQVLYAMGTIIALVGTGFVIGVSFL